MVAVTIQGVIGNCRAGRRAKVPLQAGSVPAHRCIVVKNSVGGAADFGINPPVIKQIMMTGTTGTAGNQ